jgi:hypothetical protein
MESALGKQTETLRFFNPKQKRARGALTPLALC